MYFFIEDIRIIVFNFLLVNFRYLKGKLFWDFGRDLRLEVILFVGKYSDYFV